MSLFDRKVKLYMLTNVFHIDDDGMPCDMIVYTVADNKNACEEYLWRLLKVKYKTHFEMWCNVHEKNISDESWEEYMSVNTAIQEELSEYLITKNIYKASKIATVFRMFNGCHPLGCSYEEDVEYKYFIESLDDETRSKIEEEIESMEQSQ